MTYRRVGSQLKTKYFMPYTTRVSTPRLGEVQHEITIHNNRGTVKNVRDNKTQKKTKYI